MGSRVEIFINSDMLELETLSPLYNLPPEQTITHQETWYILPYSDIPENVSEATTLRAFIQKAGSVTQD